MGILSVSVDLDEIRLYHDIHGLEPPSSQVSNVIYKRVLNRIADFFDSLNIKVTFFVVGTDLVLNDSSATMIKKLSLDGHEIANHTMNHRYDLVTLSDYLQFEEIDKCSSIIENLTGKKPAGFRAPGYNVNLGLLDKLEKRGYFYDSSVFSCPAYFAAKAAAISLKKISGKLSKSIMTDPRILTAPVMPYQLGRNGAWSKGRGLRELPVCVVTKARLPFIGTSLVLMGKTASRLLAKSAAKMSFVNLELHGIDFVDAQGDGLQYLAAHQPDLKISLHNKKRVIKSVIELLLNSGMQPLTLEKAARTVLI